LHHAAAASHGPLCAAGQSTVRGAAQITVPLKGPETYASQPRTTVHENPLRKHSPEPPRRINTVLREPSRRTSHRAARTITLLDVEPSLLGFGFQTQTKFSKKTLF